MRLSPAVKVGTLTLISVTILVFSVLWLKGRALSSGVRITVPFHDVDGMRAGSGVQIMGLRVGQIETITPVITQEDSYVNVKFVITEPGIKIPDGSEISIQQSGIIGEKFIEITPPNVNYVYLPLKTDKTPIGIKEGDKVEVFTFNDEYENYSKVGEIKTTETVDRMSLPLELREQYSSAYVAKIGFVLNVANIELPQVYEPRIETVNSIPVLRLNTKSSKVYYVASNFPYTIKEPTRIREFLDLQLQAAKALNETNNKINAVLSEDVIVDIKDALRNVKTISLKTTELIDKTTALVEGSRNDIDSLLKMANQLSEELALLANNLNTIAGDPEFQKSVVSMTKSLDESSKQISEILGDEKTKETLLYLNETMKNVSEISTSVNELTKDENIKAKVYKTVDNLSSSMETINCLLEKIDKMSPEEKEQFSNIIKDTAETTKNLKKFSEKLNKRFLLFRLMF
ncbi:MAG: MlaD family protein [Candidatus Gastranaerophilales bacterium]|nr:MlaD family protein [Candidatus Gastranaerophilales bacterium]